MTKLTIDDIADMRAYERERDEFRQSVIALKSKRRIHVGPFVTFVFENRETIRFQIQEMARVEKIISDEAIAHELETYNPLIPEPGMLAATMFIELTDKDQLMEWLPKLVGIEAAVELRIGSGASADVVPCEVDPEHEKQLTRDEITASVHYVHFRLSAAQVERFDLQPVTLAITHPAYRYEIELGEATRAELLRDLRDGG